VLLLLAGALLWHSLPVAATAAGYYAKVLCSGVFLSGRDPQSVLSEELSLDHPLAGWMKASVDRQHGLATASMAGVMWRHALYREGLGCTLDSSVRVDELRRQAAGWKPPAPVEEPELESKDAGPALKAVVDRAFAAPNAARTRAIVVVQDRRIVAERYAPGYSATQRMQGWSMTKSVLNALVGILVGEGKLSVQDRAPVQEWSAPNDPRHEITLDQLLHMNSGLEFQEVYADLTADAPVMLFRKPDAAAYAARKKLSHEPKTHWSYSSGSANIISRIVRAAAGGKTTEYWAWPRKVLFDRIGMSSAVMEPDASGTFVSSSFMYATARDWARFGLLYLNDGVWDGERILPEGWVRYSRMPAPATPHGEYGALIWLDGDTFSFNGHEGQYVVVVPSQRLVVVRLGLTQAPATWNMKDFVAGVRQALMPPHGANKANTAP